MKSGELSDNHYGHSDDNYDELGIDVGDNCEEVFNYTSSVQSGLAMLFYRISHLRETSQELTCTCTCTSQEWTCTCTSQEWTCTGFHL